jgi:hypothetical protein
MFGQWLRGRSSYVQTSDTLPDRLQNEPIVRVKYYYVVSLNI